MSKQNSEDVFYALTTEGLESLRTLSSQDPQRIWDTQLSKLTEPHPEHLTPTRFTYGDFPDLLLPTGKNKFDKENSATFYKALSQMSPVEAADERIWVTLALGHYREYLLARWPKTARVEISSHVANHVFAVSSRNRFRDNAIARLWWIARFVDRNFGDSPDKAYSVFFDLDSDVLTSYLGRPNLVSIPGVAKAVVDTAHSAFLSSSSGVTYNRDKFRAFLIDLDLENGRQLVSHKSSELIEAQVAQIFLTQFPAYG